MILGTFDENTLKNNCTLLQIVHRTNETEKKRTIAGVLKAGSFGILKENGSIKVLLIQAKRRHSVFTA